MDEAGVDAGVEREDNFQSQHWTCFSLNLKKTCLDHEALTTMASRRCHNARHCSWWVSSRYQNTPGSFRWLMAGLFSAAGKDPKRKLPPGMICMLTFIIDVRSKNLMFLLSFFFSVNVYLLFYFQRLSDSYVILERCAVTDFTLVSPSPKDSDAAAL